jgi:hypothetical protein
MSTKKFLEFDFEDVFDRIKKSTDIKNSVQLAEIIQVTQPAVSKNKKKNIFPLDWAFLIAEKYNLELTWLIRGEGKEKSKTTSKKRSNELLDEIDCWLEEKATRKPEIKDWFKYEFSKKFPEFEEWKRRVDRERENSLAQKQNVA